jgi:hypothetical protein
LADKASELEDATSCRPEEQVVVEESGVDGIRQKEGVSFDVRSVHIDDRDALLVEHAGPGVCAGEGTVVIVDENDVVRDVDEDLARSWWAVGDGMSRSRRAEARE